MKNEKKYTVFIVEDSDAYRSMLLRFLENDQMRSDAPFNISFHEFPSGEECLEHIDLNPDIIIIDYHLNGNGYEKNMNGVKLINHFRKTKPDTDIIILSSQKNVQVVKELMQQGVKEYIKKDSIALHKTHEIIEKLIAAKEEQHGKLLTT